MFKPKMDKCEGMKNSLNIRIITCDVCEKTFKYKSHLTIHKRTHSGEKPYKCGVCDNSFARKSDLTRHMLVHSGKKEFQCHVCDCVIKALLRKEV